MAEDLTTWTNEELVTNLIEASENIGAIDGATFLIPGCAQERRDAVEAQEAIRAEILRRLEGAGTK